ncbi:MAG: hypothetical protein IAG10_23400 [Planctomycetaceae bacterium]|nr:hypothetical protein [Planctomycetaceae bacterium]
MLHGISACIKGAVGHLGVLSRGIVEGIMIQLVRARYDATQNMLWLEEPLEGVRDHEMVRVEVIVNVQEGAKDVASPTANDGRPSD